MRYGMPAVDECERDAASAAGMIAMIGAGAVQPPRGQPMAVVRGQVFRVRDENRPDGRSFGPQGRMDAHRVVGGRHERAPCSGQNRPRVA